jgi:hypothetical protein
LRVVAKQDSMPWLKRWAAYIAVRFGGKGSWNS